MTPPIVSLVSIAAGIFLLGLSGLLWTQEQRGRPAPVVEEEWQTQTTPAEDEFPHDITISVTQARIMVAKTWRTPQQGEEEGEVFLPSVQMHEAADLIRSKLARNGVVSQQKAETMYKVLTDDDYEKSAMRSVESIIFEFVPQDGTTTKTLKDVGGQVAFLLRQESVLVECDLPDTGEFNLAYAQSLIVAEDTISDRKSSNNTSDWIMDALAKKFGFATRIALDEEYRPNDQASRDPSRRYFKISSILDMGNSDLYGNMWFVEKLVENKPEVVEIGGQTVYAAFVSYILY